MPKKSRADKMSILMCARIIMGEQLMIADNRVGPCDTCGHPVQYRPHAPTPHILRCMECAHELFDPDEDEMFTTPAMVADYLDYLRRQRH